MSQASLSAQGCIRACPQCGRRNRVPLDKLAQSGRCGACQAVLAPIDEPLDVEAAAFAAVTAAAGVPVLVDFWAPWCGPCRTAAPEVAQAARRLAGRALVLKLDTEAQPQVAARFAVRSIPLFAVFRGGHLVRQQAGVMPAAALETFTLAAEAR